MESVIESRRHRKPEQKQDLVFKIRQVLNTAFIILSIIAIGVYSYGVWYRPNVRIEMMGVVIAVTAVVIKMSESMLRMKKG